MLLSLQYYLFVFVLLFRRFAPGHAFSLTRIGDAVSVSTQYGRRRPTTTTQLQYRDIDHPEDEIVTSSPKTLSCDIAVSPNANPAIMSNQVKIKPSQQTNTGGVPTRVDIPTIFSIVLSQLTIMLFSTVGFGIISFTMSIKGLPCMMDYTMGSSLFHSISYAGDCPTNVALGIGGAIPLVLVSQHIRNSMSPLSIVDEQHEQMESGDTLRAIFRSNQIEVTDMVLKLLGRRQYRFHNSTIDSIAQQVSAIDSTISEPNTSTATSIAVLALVSGVTSISAELIYRVYVPIMIYSMTDNALAFVLPAVLYGCSHIDWNQKPTYSTVRQDVVSELWMVLYQTITAIWYSFLLYMSGSIYTSILAHLLHDMDTLTSTWHHINNQLDYVDEQEQQSIPEATKVRIEEYPETRTNPMMAQMSPEAILVSRRIFSAFDSERVGSLNEANVHEMIQYIYYQKDFCPSTWTVSNLFHRYAVGWSTKDGSPQQRLEYREFLHFLQEIRCSRKVQQPTSSIDEMILYNTATATTTAMDMTSA
jgi:Type II CAAX prenyl endopeptidase Rce1-like